MSNLSRRSENPLNFIDECRAIYRGELDTAFPEDLQNTLVDTPNATTLRFIMWTHKQENQKNVIPLLAGCDILAIEDCRDVVFETKSEIDSKISSINELYRSLTEIIGDMFKSRSQKIKLLHSHDLFEQDINAVFESCIDNIQTITRIDVGPAEAKGLAVLDQVLLDRKKEFETAIQSPVTQWDQLRGYALAVSSAHSKVDLYREVIIAQQLEKLTNDNPGKTIAVLIGRSHHTLTSKVDANKIQVQRFFVKDETAKDSPAFRKQWVGNILVSADALRAGYDPTYELDQIILYEIVSYYGEYEMLSILEALVASKNNQLLRQLQKIWQKPVAENQPDTDDKIQTRIQTTRQLLRINL